jgi:hypothetical protein
LFCSLPSVPVPVDGGRGDDLPEGGGEDLPTLRSLLLLPAPAPVGGELGPELPTLRSLPRLRLDGGCGASASAIDADIDSRQAVTRNEMLYATMTSSFKLRRLGLCALLMRRTLLSALWLMIRVST